jgi:hypothetical protein
MAALSDYQVLAARYESTLRAAQQSAVWQQYDRVKTALLSTFRVTPQTAVSFTQSAYRQWFQHEPSWLKAQKLFASHSENHVPPEEIDGDALDHACAFDEAFVATLKDKDVMVAREAKKAFKAATFALFKQGVKPSELSLSRPSVAIEKAAEWYTKYFIR